MLRTAGGKLHGNSQQSASLKLKSVEVIFEFGDTCLDIILYGLACRGQIPGERLVLIVGSDKLIIDLQDALTLGMITYDRKVA